jgi:arylsulfatase A-like enzyme
MNFQSVSVAQKLKKCMPTDTQRTGGYSNPQGVPLPCLAGAINWVDKQIGSMVQTLGAPGLKDTLVIISAKHGQSPIDYSKRVTYNDGVVITAPINAGACGANFAADSADDGVLIWLKKQTSGSTDCTADAVSQLNAYTGASGTGIGEWLSGPLLVPQFGNPAFDPRTPDIIGVANVGTIYTGGSKIAEHGGFNEDDTHVALIVSNPSFQKQFDLATPVATAQIAPTIVKSFGIKTTELTAVAAEGTQPLPGVFKERSE